MPTRPSAAHTLLQQGHAAHRAGNREEAERLYRAALRIDPRFAEGHSAHAAVLGELGKHQDGVRAAKRAIKHAPGVARYHLILGNLHLATDRAGRARDAYREAVRLEPSVASHRFNLGLALQRAGDLAGAEREYREGAGRDPRDVRCRVNLSQLLQEAGRPYDAIEVLDEIARSSLKILQVWITLGNALRLTDQGDRAIANYRRALELLPGNPYLLMNLGQVLRETGHTDEAIATYRQVIAAAPNLVEARFALAIARRQERRDDDYYAVIEAIAKDPEAHGVRPSDALFTHAKILDDVGDDEAAFAQMLAANAARRATRPGSGASGSPRPRRATRTRRRRSHATATDLPRSSTTSRSIPGAWRIWPAGGISPPPRRTFAPGSKPGWPSRATPGR